MARGVKHQVIEASVDVFADLCGHRIGIGAHDPALCDLLDCQGIRRLFHLDRVGEVVLLFGGERQRCPKAGVLERKVGIAVVGEFDLDHVIDGCGIPSRLLGACRNRGNQLLGVEVHPLA